MFKINAKGRYFGNLKTLLKKIPQVEQSLSYKMCNVAQTALFAFGKNHYIEIPDHLCA